MQIHVKKEETIELSPRQMAEVFWNMDENEQDDFFHELANVVAEETDSRAITYSHGEMQWCHMTQAIKKRSKQARECFLAFSAFAYDYWPQKSEWEL